MIDGAGTDDSFGSTGTADEADAALGAIPKAAGEIGLGGADMSTFSPQLLKVMTVEPF